MAQSPLWYFEVQVTKVMRIFISLFPFGWGRARRRVGLLLMVVVTTAAQTLVPLPPVGAANGEQFSDIEEAGSHQPAVERLAEQGVLEGTECAPGKFCPTEPIQRWVMAVWLISVLDDTEPADVETTRFTDVEADQWWMPYVERLADLGITKGCSTEPARYCPTEPVTRAQMTSVLVRAFQLPAGSSNRFTDTGDSTHQRDINALASSGITIGCATDPARYCPSRDTTRAEMATFLTRALDYEPSPIAEGSFISLTAGSFHTCGLLIDGTIDCWGNDFDNQAEPPPGEFTSIASGDYHSCGIRTDHTITCWGNNTYGQAISPQGEFTAVAAGAVHSCGIRTDLTLACWGSTQHGRADPPTGKFTAIATGTDHSCGLRTDRTITCWGNNDESQADPPDGAFTAITAGWDYTCALGLNRTVTCWGQNISAGGIPPDGKFITVEAGWYYTCALATDSTIDCWGHPSGDSLPSGEFGSMALGGQHSCVVGNDLTVTCWGRTNTAKPTHQTKPSLPSLPVTPIHVDCTPTGQSPAGARTIAARRTHRKENSSPSRRVGTSLVQFATISPSTAGA